MPVSVDLSILTHSNMKKRQKIKIVQKVDHLSARSKQTEREERGKKEKTYETNQMNMNFFLNRFIFH